MGFVSRNKALKLIQMSKAAISSPENLYSYFLLDCASYKLIIFYNKNYKPKKNFITDLFVPIDYNDFQKSLKIIKKINFAKFKKKAYFKVEKFNNYFSVL